MSLIRELFRSSHEFFRSFSVINGFGRFWSRLVIDFGLMLDAQFYLCCYSVSVVTLKSFVFHLYSYGYGRAFPSFWLWIHEIHLLIHLHYFKYHFIPAWVKLFFILLYIICVISRSILTFHRYCILVFGPSVLGMGFIDSASGWFGITMRVELQLRLTRDLGLVPDVLRSITLYMPFCLFSLWVNIDRKAPNFFRFRPKYEVPY